MKVTDTWTGDALVALDPDHPGFSDAESRARRNTIARQSTEFDGAGPVPDVAYTEEEHDVWRKVWAQLQPAHEALACGEYKACLDRLELGCQRIPQLREVNARLQPQQGFRMHPVAGLIKAGYFLSYLGRDIFLATQYIRHHSRPYYTPEPDVVHELVGHAATLADPSFARLSREFGHAANRTADPAVIQHLERLYWFTLEFGVVDQDGPKAFGAGLLSSAGELTSFVDTADLRKFDIAEIIEHDYDPTEYQSTLYVVDDIGRASDTIIEWLRRQG